MTEKRKEFTDNLLLEDREMFEKYCRGQYRPFLFPSGHSQQPGHPERLKSALGLLKNFICLSKSENIFQLI